MLVWSVEYKLLDNSPVKQTAALSGIRISKRQVWGCKTDLLSFIYYKIRNDQIIVSSLINTPTPDETVGVYKFYVCLYFLSSAPYILKAFRSENEALAFNEPLYSPQIDYLSEYANEFESMVSYPCGVQKHHKIIPSSRVRTRDLDPGKRHKSLLPLNEKCVFENVSLVVVKMKSGTMKVVNMPTKIEKQCRETLQLGMINRPRLSPFAPSSQFRHRPPCRSSGTATILNGGSASGVTTRAIGGSRRRWEWLACSRSVFREMEASLVPSMPVFCGR
ncbi:hypothetical protein YC2023_022797 [Brassica napus]